MLFQSKFSCYQVFVRPEIPHYHDLTGVLTSTTKALTAEFGSIGSEFQFENWIEGGRKDTGVEIRGHYFDTEEAAKRLSWTDDERESVEAVLLQKCQETPTWVWVADRPEEEILPDAPWATYDSTHHWKIPKAAADLELVPQALAYERATKNREGVVAALEDQLGEFEKAEPLTAS